MTQCHVTAWTGLLKNPAPRSTRYDDSGTGDEGIPPREHLGAARVWLDTAAKLREEGFTITPPMLAGVVEAAAPNLVATGMILEGSSNRTGAPRSSRWFRPRPSGTSRAREHVPGSRHVRSCSLRDPRGIRPIRRVEKTRRRVEFIVRVAKAKLPEDLPGRCVLRMVPCEQGHGAHTMERVLDH